MISRRAPSRFEKRVGIAGMYIPDYENGDFLYFEESFRTWKMDPDRLEMISVTLFEKLVSGEDLTVFYPENSGDEEFIEFPNSNTWYNAEKRKWETSLFVPSSIQRTAGG